MPIVNELPKVDVFAVPKPHEYRYFSRDWNLRWPLFRARVAVQEESDCLKVQIVDLNDGGLIAQASYDGDCGVRLCSDSSLHYALIAKKGEIVAVLGIGFLDHNQSFDFSLSLQSFSRRKAAEQRMDNSWSSRMVAAKEREGGQDPLAPALAPPPSSAKRWSRFDSDSESDDDAQNPHSIPNNGKGSLNAGGSLAGDEEEFGDFQ